MKQDRLTIDIRPPVSVYATYSRLSYEPQYAIAEFVDNSTQSYFEHKRELKAAFKKEKERKLVIELDYDHQKNQLRIVDNANGMDFEELKRAVKLNQPPKNRDGRCEYGMGLKTAACWFGRKFSIETKRLGLNERYSVLVDIQDLSDRDNEKLEVCTSKAKPEDHYTILTIKDLYRSMNGRTIGKIKEQLSSIYREDIKSGDIELRWRGETLEYTEPQYLKETLPDGKEIVWKKDISFEVPHDAEGSVLPVTGWVGVMSPGKREYSGFVLLRRGRAIVGGPDRGYRPKDIFGEMNSFRYMRLIGELNLDDWPVTQAKDAFDWDGTLEENFIEKLKRAIKEYASKAENLRVTKTPAGKQELQEAAMSAQKLFADKDFSKNIEREIYLPTPKSTPEQNEKELKKIREKSEGPFELSLKIRNKTWVFKIYWQLQTPNANWMTLDFPSDTEIMIYLNSSHPFFEPYVTNSQDQVLLHKIVAALALAEKMARELSTDNLVDAADFRMNMNHVLKYASEIRDN